MPARRALINQAAPQRAGWRLDPAGLRSLAQSREEERYGDRAPGNPTVPAGPTDREGEGGRGRWMTGLEAERELRPPVSEDHTARGAVVGSRFAAAAKHDQPALRIGSDLTEIDPCAEERPGIEAVGRSAPGIATPDVPRAGIDDRLPPVRYSHVAQPGWRCRRLRAGRTAPHDTTVAAPQTSAASFGRICSALRSLRKLPLGERPRVRIPLSPPASLSQQ